MPAPLHAVKKKLFDERNARLPPGRESADDVEHVVAGDVLLVARENDEDVQAGQLVPERTRSRSSSASTSAATSFDASQRTKAAS